MGFPLLAPGGGLPTGEKGKAFQLFQGKGFQQREGGWFPARGGSGRQEELFQARAQARGDGVPVGSREWLCKGSEGPASRAFPTRGQGGFQQGCRGGSDKQKEHAHGGWWCSNGVTGWLCKEGGGPAGKAFPARGQGGFQQGCREGSDGQEELFQ